MTLMPGDAFDHYRVQAKLGEGGMGAVYRVQDVDSGELLAVKLPKQADATFLAEMRAIAALRHPHIVRFRMVYPMQDGQFALFMDYVKGVDVLEFAQQGHSLHDLLTVLNQTALALDHAHAHGVVHRDVKHANVMVTSGDRGPVALVVDFGLGRDMGYAMTRTQSGVIGGTGPFMSPEQSRGLRQAGPASDQWALAVMAWHLLNGELPFGVHPGTGLPDHSRRAHVSPRLREVEADLDRTFGRAFAHQPDHRFGTCLDFTQELGAVFGVPLPTSATTRPRGPIIDVLPPVLPRLPEALIDPDDAVVRYAVARLSGQASPSSDCPGRDARRRCRHPCSRHRSRRSGHRPPARTGGVGNRPHHHRGAGSRAARLRVRAPQRRGRQLDAGSPHRPPTRRHCPSRPRGTERWLRCVCHAGGDQRLRHGDGGRAEVRPCNPVGG